MAEARMFTDIRVRRGVLGNLKVRKLCARFGLQAMGALVGLWNHAADNAPDDGVIGHMTDEDVGFVSRYADYHPERAAEFGAALRELGFLDVLGDGRLAVHDWKEEQGFIAGATGRKARAEGTGSAGGVASRDARRAKYGTAQPPKALPNNPEQTPEQLSNNSEGPLRAMFGVLEPPDRTGPDRTVATAKVRGRTFPPRA